MIFAFFKSHQHAPPDWSSRTLCVLHWWI